jgi:hypothetical protein
MTDEYVIFAKLAMPEIILVPVSKYTAKIGTNIKNRHFHIWYHIWH